jgi:fluoroacetyl-CoA thioesterase
MLRDPRAQRGAERTPSRRLPAERDYDGMKDTLKVGVAREARYTVTREMAPPHLPRIVLSTPSMISLIEGTCLAAGQEHLDDGETTVGTHVCVSHLAAVGEGEEIVVRCRLTTIQRRRLTFDVEVDGPRGRVSDGTHQRAVVSLDRMTG